MNELADELSQDPSLLPRLFASAGRRLRPLGQPQPDSIWDPTPEDTERIALLEAVSLPWTHLDELYRYGDSNERRAVLRAMGVLPDPDPSVVARLAADALRTNDSRLVAAALSPRALQAMDAAALGQAVLKVAFLDLDVRCIPGVVALMTAELSHQLMGLVLERVAAGRDVPVGIGELVARFPDDDAETELRRELMSALPARREAACRALQDLEGAGR